MAGPQFVVVDVETTGLSPAACRIVELGVVITDEVGQPIWEWSSRFNPHSPVGATHIHGITDADVVDAPLFADFVPYVSQLLAGRVVVAHNVSFDLAFLQSEYRRAGWTLPNLPTVCTLKASRTYIPSLGQWDLGSCCDVCEIQLVDKHSALGDALATAGLLHTYLTRTLDHGAWLDWQEAAVFATTIHWPTGPTHDPLPARASTGIERWGALIEAPTTYGAHPDRSTLRRLPRRAAHATVKGVARQELAAVEGGGMHSRDRPITRLLLAHQGAEPDALPETLAASVVGIGGHDVALFLIDYGHTKLTPHLPRDQVGNEPEVATLDGSMVGRAFTSSTVLAADHYDEWHVWVPVTEQSNRLGVLALTVPVWDEQIEFLLTELGLAAAPLLLASAQYTDLPHRLQRRKNMGLAAEMQWSLLPPLSFSAGGTTIAGLLEPAYEVGGDCFDYAYNDGVLDLIVLDTVGHGLSSAVLAALLVGAYRHGRREGDDLPGLAVRIDAAARTFHEQPAFATAILGRLDTASGTLDWMTCGHPLPILVRDGAVVPAPVVRPGVPLGFGDLGPVHGDLTRVRLQPGDGVLLYTDGVVECRMPDGTFFGEERLSDLFSREHTAGSSPHEVVRRLTRTATEHSQDDLRDDATMVYVCWDGQPRSAPTRARVE